MELLLANWDLILIIVIAIIGGSLGVMKWLSQPSSAQKEQIRTVLLQLVILAESRFGSGTGKVKLSFVYFELLKHFTWLKFVPVTVVESLIDESLVTMRKLLESNTELKKIVEDK